MLQILMLIVDFPLTFCWVLLVQRYFKIANENKNDEEYEKVRDNVRRKFIINAIPIVLLLAFIVEVKFDSPCSPESKASYEDFRKQIEGDSKYDNISITYPWDKEK